jgi:hypothetical protein
MSLPAASTRITRLGGAGIRVAGSSNVEVFGNVLSGTPTR